MDSNGTGNSHDSPVEVRTALSPEEGTGEQREGGKEREKREKGMGYLMVSTISTASSHVSYI